LPHGQCAGQRIEEQAHNVKSLDYALIGGERRRTPERPTDPPSITARQALVTLDDSYRLTSVLPSARGVRHWRRTLQGTRRGRPTIRTVVLTGADPGFDSAGRRLERCRSPANNAAAPDRMADALALIRREKVRRNSHSRLSPGRTKPSSSSSLNRAAGGPILAWVGLTCDPSFRRPVNRAVIVPAFVVCRLGLLPESAKTSWAAHAARRGYQGALAYYAWRRLPHLMPHTAPFELVLVQEVVEHDRLLASPDDGARRSAQFCPPQQRPR